MIVVTGGFTAAPDTAERLRAAALDHVHRSRAEDGCLSHDVFTDAENPLRFFFHERWRDRAALDAHFRVPASGAFVALLRREAAAIEELSVDVIAAALPVRRARPSAAPVVGLVVGVVAALPLGIGTVMLAAARTSHVPPNTYLFPLPLRLLICLAGAALATGIGTMAGALAALVARLRRRAVV